MGERERSGEREAGREVIDWEIWTTERRDKEESNDDIWES